MQKKEGHQSGFSTTELVVAAAITSSLAAIGTPAYISQVNSNCQRQAETITGQLMTQYQAFHDEYGEAPIGWSELDRIATIMSPEGPVSGSNFSPVTLGSCRNKFAGEKLSENFVFTAYPSKEKQPQQSTDDTKAPELQYIDALNVVSCINTTTGASAIKRGDGQKPATPSDLHC
jgi:type II secretory pathway pseudopilin PulG